MSDFPPSEPEQGQAPAPFPEHQVFEGRDGATDALREEEKKRAEDEFEESNRRMKDVQDVYQCPVCGVRLAPRSTHAKCPCCANTVTPVVRAFYVGENKPLKDSTVKNRPEARTHFSDSGSPNPDKGYLPQQGPLRRISRNPYARGSDA